MSDSAIDLESRIREALKDAWLPGIYRERILKMRTRAYEFPPLPAKAAPQIHHTLLGIELQVGRTRMLCPDLATARYLAVFARIGCRVIAIPYDITRISHIADELESSWHRTFLLADKFASGKSARFQSRLRKLLETRVREEIREAGAGPRIPEFRQTTKQGR